VCGKRERGVSSSQFALLAILPGVVKQSLFLIAVLVFCRDAFLPVFLLVFTTEWLAGWPYIKSRERLQEPGF